ncbi:hypothetical protein GJT99_01370 [Enterobacteriaceae endosymbiont of Donacia cincticornis]|uniref:YggT family protein n=1 Tax=Enterobacteriaceae endosymbiont of Donacia cincticornis TaxID=2675773 RepID=UPI0014499092|nr:YggT family protein [Enterobacteriaceae endosymbiont of Donacia cincticornis]QJC36160.1 hypothetical protein GJT99_01370 [Enterobacteriaceae endosymbiont of Donacia cincticornis]
MVKIICLCKHLMELIILFFLLRLWIFYSINNYYNTFIRFIVTFTDILLKYIKKFLPIKQNNELLTIIVILFFLFFKYPILIFLQHRNLFHKNIIIYIFISILTLFKIIGFLLFYIITIYLILNFINLRFENLNEILEIFINQIYLFIKIICPNIYYLNIFLFIINIILYLLNNLLMDLFPQFWFLI